MARRACRPPRVFIKIERSALSESKFPRASLVTPATRAGRHRMSAKQAEKLIENLGILVVDESLYMRKLTRMMLMNIGAKTIYEASDGVAALDIIRTANPDVAIIDWDLPVLSGPQVVRIVRSPDVFPKPHLPIIMLTASAQPRRRRGGDAARRPRVPAQADVAARVAGPAAVDHRQAAADGADRQASTCRSRAASAKATWCCGADVRNRVAASPDCGLSGH